MARTINVRLIDTRADDPISDLTLPATMTYRKLVEANGVSLDKVTLTVRVDGTNISYNLDDQVHDGASVSVTPTNVKAA